MMNPLWVDARDYLTSQGQPVTTGGLNQAMNLLASNPQLRPSAVKAGGGAAGIAAGLGAPTDQIVQTPLAPPSGITETPLPPPAARGGPSPASQSAGRGKQGASSGNRTAGGTSASKHAPPVPVAKPSTANGPASLDRFTQNLQAADRTPMGGYTPPAPPNAPSSPVGTAQAGTGGDDGGFLSHLMEPGRLAALGGAGASILAALLMGRGRNEAGARPINSREGEVIPPDRMTVYGQGRGEGPIINGDPIQELLGQSETAAPQGAPQVAGPQSFEDMIAQLAASAPQSAISGPGGRAIAPPVAKPPIQMGNSTSGPPIAIPPTGGQQLMQLLQGLGRQ